MIKELQCIIVFPRVECCNVLYVCAVGRWAKIFYSTFKTRKLEGDCLSTSSSKRPWLASFFCLEGVLLRTLLGHRWSSRRRLWYLSSMSKKEPSSASSEDCFYGGRDRMWMFGCAGGEMWWCWR